MTSCDHWSLETGRCSCNQTIATECKFLFIPIPTSFDVHKVVSIYRCPGFLDAYKVVLYVICCCGPLTHSLTRNGV